MSKEITDTDRLEWLLANHNCEAGWHENPENHTISVTLFFGNLDTSPLLKHGPGNWCMSFDRDMLDAVITHMRGLK
jgi:hypothetical protein